MDSPVPSGSRADALALEQELGRIMREKRAREKAPKSPTCERGLARERGPAPFLSVYFHLKFCPPTHLPGSWTPHVRSDSSRRVGELFPQLSVPKRGAPGL
jgi:hypothetical protein